MFLRIAGLGLAGMALATATAAVAGATVAGAVVLACAARRRAKDRAGWPEEAAAPPPGQAEES